MLGGQENRKRILSGNSYRAESQIFKMTLNQRVQAVAILLTRSYQIRPTGGLHCQML